MRDDLFKKTVFWLNVCVAVAVAALDIALIISPTWALKSAASVCFVVGAAINLAYAVTHGAKKTFVSLMLVGCVFAMAGDIVNYLSGDVYFIVGTALFAIAHIFYVIAYYFLYRFRYFDLIAAACVFLPSVLVITLVPIFDFGGIMMETVCVVYAAILSLMVGKALSNLGHLTPISILIAVGSILFYISDLSLLINMFGTVHTVPRIICLATYYPAQIILAFSIIMSSFEKASVTLYRPKAR